MLMLSPISVCASDLADPVEPSPTFHGYKVLGYDDLGNAVLEYDDYLEYFNSCLEERAEGLENGTIQPDAEPVPFSAYSVQPYDFLDALDEVKQITDKTRFISKSDWLGLAWDFAKYMLENPTMSGGTEATFSEKISSVGKQRLYYTKSDIYENITFGVDFDITNKEGKFRITRSGFGALSTYYMYSPENADITLKWSAYGYRLYVGECVSSGSDPDFTRDIYIEMRSYSINSLPVSTESSSTALLNNDVDILDGIVRGYVPYAENTFATNSYQQNANHYLINNSNNYWNPITIYNVFPIQAGTTINQSNVNQYSEYGYTWNNTTNTIDFDPDILAAYINNELMPQLELMYENFYKKFPDIDANITDEDITYVDPFEQATEPPETLPPATFPPGSGGGMTPEELDAVLNQETYYILDMETDLPLIAVDSLPDVENFPSEITAAASGLSSFVIDLFSGLGLLQIFVAFSVLAFIVFAIRG